MYTNPDIWNHFQCILPLLACIGLLFLVLQQARRSSHLTRSVLRSLRHGGPIPRHVAFIMDGNRRWARRSNLAVHEGHIQGGEKLTESLQWCLDVGISIVTVYAFSLENFKRPENEVAEIMRLCEQKFKEMLEESDTISRNRVRVRVLGDLSRIPQSLRTLMQRVMVRTAHFENGPVLNICFAYTSRFDIAASVAKVVNMCDDGKLHPDDILEGTLASCLSTGFCNGDGAVMCYPDLLVRTSGETRISDFLLWESCFSVLSFCNALWPELTAWDFVFLILDYQTKARARAHALTRYRQHEGIHTMLEHKWSVTKCNERVQKALQSARSDYFSSMQNVDRIRAPAAVL